MTIPPAHRPDLLVMGYDSNEWERFIGEWMRSLKDQYLEVKRVGAANDHGLDVIGFTDLRKLEGIWDNSQCKHYRTSIPTADGLSDVGKLIYWAHQGKFKPPRRSRFVAPKGPCGPLRTLLDNPSQLRRIILDDWDKYCSKITASGAALTPELRAYVEAFDFTIFGWTHIDEVLEDLKKTAFYAARFGGHLAPPPRAIVPEELEGRESRYVGQLLAVYSEEIGAVINSHSDLPPGHETCADFKRQRERFFEMEFFVHHYRDQTPPRTIEDFVEEIYDAVQPVCAKEYPRSFERLNETMARAAIIKTKSILEAQARVRVKQGACHHLANDDLLKWKR